MTKNHYIYQSIVGGVKDKTIDWSTALSDSIEAHKIAIGYTQLTNIVGDVIEAIVSRYITEGKATDLTVIKSALLSTGTEFESRIANMLSDQVVLIAIATGHQTAIENIANLPAKTMQLKSKLSSLKVQIQDISINFKLSQIVENVNNHTMSNSLALQKVYALYESNKDNGRICDNLCTLVGMCIRDHVINDSLQKSTVMSVLNKLKYNKSTTYKNSAVTLKKERESILNELPFEARTLLTGGYTIGTSLSPDGVKLKNALQLYLDLS
jgi:hypothetical protein